MVTHKPVEVATSIISEFGSGVTQWQGQGMYSGGSYSILFCAVNRADMPRMREIIEKHDPEAFMVIGHAHQRIGGSLRRKPGEKPLSEAALPKILEATPEEAISRVTAG
ncbi:MAG: YitT family protein [Deinococcales bacterium]